MNLKRIARHLLVTRRHVNTTFPRAALASIERAIEAGETTHSGQVRFAVEGALDGSPLFQGHSSRRRALDLFAQLHVWDTEHNNGVLIYVLLADRAVEVVADRGIQSRVGSQAFESICRAMEAAFKRGDFEGGLIRGVDAVSLRLAEHFSASGEHANELSNKPVVL